MVWKRGGGGSQLPFEVVPSHIHSFNACEASDRTGTGARFWNQEVVSEGERVRTPNTSSGGVY